MPIVSKNLQEPQCHEYMPIYNKLEVLLVCQAPYLVLSIDESFRSRLFWTTDRHLIPTPANMGASRYGISKILG